MPKHAKLSPSGAHRWMACPGSVVLEAQFPPSSSKYADEGTAAHELAAMAFEGGLAGPKPCSAFIGRRIEVGPAKTVEVTAEMAADTQRYVDAIYDRIKGYEAEGARVDIFVEQALPIGHVTNEDGASGTGDVVLVVTYPEPDGRCIIDVNDLKFGRGVPVDAEENPQLMLYALGALEVVDPLGVEPTEAVLVIHQPRLYAVSEWSVSIEELMAFTTRVRHAAAQVRKVEDAPQDLTLYLTPGDKQCQFCRAKATCPALAKKVAIEVGLDFDDLTAEPVLAEPAHEAELLSKQMAACDLIETWIKGVRAEVERRLLAGEKVPGYKLVQGRAGARSWDDPAAVEEYLKKSVRLKTEEMYEFSLISPTTAEKLLKKGTIGPKQWDKLGAHITRSDGKKSVAPESDKRPAIEVEPVIDSFEVVE